MKAILLYQNDGAHVLEVASFTKQGLRDIRDFLYRGDNRGAIQLAKDMVARGWDVKTMACDYRGDILACPWEWGIGRHWPGRVVVSSREKDFAPGRLTRSLARKPPPQAEIAPQPLRNRATSYHQYLKSKEWRSKRRYALHIAGHRCRMCNRGDRRLEAHHRTYERLGDELPTDLIVLCESCHKLFHQNGRIAPG